MAKAVITRTKLTKKITHLGFFLLLLSGISFLVLGSVLACNVPVFRYALEKWDAGAHEVVVFHKGNLGKEGKAGLAELQGMLDFTPPRTNIRLRVVDLSKKQSAEDEKLFLSLKNPQLPAMVVRFPASSPLAKPYQVMSLSKGNVAKLLNSPLRTEIASQLLKGTSAVWVVLESGNIEKDQGAVNLLQDQLRKLEKKLKLPELTNDPEDRIDSKDVPLQLKFSVLRLKRDNPKEKFLVEMLLSTEEDLRRYAEPMVFPIYGRGRALYALIGKGINADTIEEAGSFLVGPCTCTIKEQNPGVELLMSTRWDSILGSRLVKERELPPLTGLDGFLPAKKGKTGSGEKSKSGNQAGNLGSRYEEFELEPVPQNPTGNLPKKKRIGEKK